MVMDQVAPLSFGALLKRHRRALGLSQERLAAQAGYTTAYISMLERGERAPVAATAELLAVALDLALDLRVAFLQAAQAAQARRRAPGASDDHDAATRLRGGAPKDQLIGRDTELAMLTAALDAALGGAGRFIALAGEPGIGKTQLMQEVARRAQARGALVGLGRCYERQQAVAYAPFTEALGALEAAASQALRAEARQRWPFLRRLLPETSDTPLAPHLAMSASGSDDQRSLWWQTQGFLHAVATAQPVVLALDDLHWADEASLDLLSHLTRHISTVPVLLLGSYRDTELHARRALQRTLHDLRRERLVERIKVPRLTREETTALATTELGAAVAEALGAELQRATEGNPFFTLEVLRLLRQRDDLTLQEGCWQRRTTGELEAPETVREAISERVERLSPSTQAALEAASVLGQMFAYTPLRRMGERAPADLTEIDDALDEAFLAGLISESPREGSRLDIAYSFSHALVQRAIYAAMPAPRRRRLHLAAGEALEATPPHQRAARAAEVAAHFLAGDAAARALPYVLEAGQHAARLFAWSDAARHYQLGVELARELGERAHEAEALGRQAEALTLMGRFDEALATFETANTLHREVGNLDQLAWNTTYMARNYTSLGQAEEGLACLEALLASLAAIAGEELAERQEGRRTILSLTAARQTGQGPVSLTALQSRAAQAATLMSPRSAARVYHSLTIYLWFMGHYDEAAILGEQAVAHARAAVDSGTLLRAQAFYGLALVGLGRLPQAAAAFQQVRATAEEVGDPEALFLATGNLGEIYRLRGALALAARELDGAHEAAEKSAVPDNIVQAWCGSGMVAFLFGKWDEACQRYARAEELARACGDSAPGGAWLHQGMLFLAEGQTQQAHALLNEVIAQAEHGHDLPILRMARAVLAEEELVQGQPGAACQQLERLLELPGAESIEAMALMPLLAWAEADKGNLERAQELINESITRVAAQEYQLALVDALRVQALLALRQQSWSVAERAIEESLTLARPMPYPYAEAKALYVYGVLHRQRGEAEQARQRFEEALLILNRLGERLYAVRIGQTLTQLRD